MWGDPQDVRRVLKEFAKGAEPGLADGAPILIDDDRDDRDELTGDKTR